MKQPEEISESSLWPEINNNSFLTGRRLHLLEQTESTNKLAMEMARAEAPAGTIIVAESQTLGRGRLGKTWMSPPGTGLYFSMILRPGLEPAEMPRLTLAAGLAVCQAINLVCKIHPMIKWPNDILLAERKCGGILTEAELPGNQSPRIVLGIGLNVSTPVQAFPPELRESATSLQDHAAMPVVRGELLSVLVAEIEKMIYRLKNEEFFTILADWRKRDATKDREMTWVNTSGQKVKGISLGPDSEGRLHIRDNDGNIHEILSGDIRLAG